MWLPTPRKRLEGNMFLSDNASYEPPCDSVLLCKRLCYHGLHKLETSHKLHRLLATDASLDLKFPSQHKSLWGQQLVFLRKSTVYRKVKQQASQEEFILTTLLCIGSSTWQLPVAASEAGGVRLGHCSSNETLERL